MKRKDLDDVWVLFMNVMSSSVKQSQGYDVLLEVKNVEKRDLPTKMCPVCQRPFSWRKKWERNWDEVKFCSERCRHVRTKIKP